MTPRRVLVGSLVVGLVVGFIVGSAGSSVLGFSSGKSSVSTPNESLVLSSGTGCSPAPQSGGWVGQQSVHDTMAVAFNYTVVHEATAIDVNATLDPSENGDYFLRIRTSPDATESAKKGPAPDGCQPSTNIDAAVTVPRDYDTITVVIDGKQVTTIENDGSTTARYHLVNGTS